MDTTARLPSWAVGATLALVILVVAGIGYMVLGPKPAVQPTAAEVQATQAAEKPGDPPSGAAGAPQDGTQRAD
jgi:hypothetical protein